MKRLISLCFLISMVLSVKLVDENESNAKIMFNKTEWVKRMETLAKGKSQYRMEYPWNVLLYDGTYWWCDCKKYFLIYFS